MDHMDSGVSKINDVKAAIMNACMIYEAIMQIFDVVRKTIDLVIAIYSSL
jgi:hypothetical protein